MAAVALLLGSQGACELTEEDAGADLDIWGLEEIVSTAQFSSLKAQLPGYAGFLANDASVVNGPAYYSDFSNAEQKVGLLYKSSVASVLGSPSRWAAVEPRT